MATELTSPSAGQRLDTWLEIRVQWLVKHWLAFINLSFIIYLGLPFLAPILLANGYTGSANTIYRMYRLVCHQIPSRAYFIAGEQVPLCHRDVAIYSAMIVGGLLFGLVRHRLKPLGAGWYLLLILPMAMDGGMQLISEVNQYVPMLALWLLGLVIMGGLSVFLVRQRRFSWHWFVILGCGLVALLYLQFIGPYASNYTRRTLTGLLFGFSTVWLVFPFLEEALVDIRPQHPQKAAARE